MRSVSLTWSYRESLNCGTNVVVTLMVDGKRNIALEQRTNGSSGEMLLSSSGEMLLSLGFRNPTWISGLTVGVKRFLDYILNPRPRR